MPAPTVSVQSSKGKDQSSKGKDPPVRSRSGERAEKRGNRRSRETSEDMEIQELANHGLSRSASNFVLRPDADSSPSKCNDCDALKKIVDKQYDAHAQQMRQLQSSITTQMAGLFDDALAKVRAAHFVRHTINV